jgi:hypothetical protein
MSRLAKFLLCLLAAFAVSAAAQHGSATHGDHNPHHGGLVDMWGVLHYEVALPPAGGVTVYFTDELRNDLPASTVKRVRVEIVRPDRSIEPVAMAISRAGDAWVGRSRPVSDPKSVVRLAFVHRGGEAIVEVYADALPRLAKPKPAATKAKAKPAAKLTDPHAGH